MRDPAPWAVKNVCSKEQTQMAARFGHLHQLLGRRADQSRHREQLIDRDDLIPATRQQKDWRAELR